MPVMLSILDRDGSYVGILPFIKLSFCLSYNDFYGL